MLLNLGGLAECPELTVWCMSLYSTEFGGDRKVRFESVHNAYVVTALAKCL